MTIVVCALIIIVLMTLLFTGDGILDWLIDKLPEREYRNNAQDWVPVIPYGNHREDDGADERLVKSVEEYVARLRAQNQEAYANDSTSDRVCHDQDVITD